LQAELEEIGDKAGKEFQLEKALASMKAEWEPVMFDLDETYRNTGEEVVVRGIIIL
jgi:hypothetical protein